MREIYYSLNIIPWTTRSLAIASWLRPHNVVIVLIFVYLQINKDLNGIGKALCQSFVSKPSSLRMVNNRWLSVCSFSIQKMFIQIRYLKLWLLEIYSGQTRPSWRERERERERRSCLLRFPRSVSKPIKKAIAFTLVWLFNLHQWARLALFMTRIRSNFRLSKPPCLCRLR